MIRLDPSAERHTEFCRTPPDGAGTGLPPLARIDGWPVHVPTLGTAVDAVIGRTRKRQPTTLFTLNLDHVVKLRRDPRFRAAYAAASVVTADGAPVVWLARSQGVELTRTTGADLVVPLARAAAVNELPVALFGTSAPVLATASERLHEFAGPGLTIAWAESPRMGFDPTGPEADAALRRMHDTGARLVFLALGAPKQELLAARAQALGLPMTFACIGAGLDFLAGTQRRAPVALQRHGLEWAWRLATDPRRLFTRYASCAAVLADIAVVAPARRQWSSAGRGTT